jgi:superfamily II DNA helicase RecQ
LLLSEKLNLRSPLTLYSELFRPELEFDVFYRPRGGIEKLFPVLEINTPAILFLSTVKDCQDAATKLKNISQLQIALFHADVNESLDTSIGKDQILESFLNDDISIVVATVAFSLGVNKSDIRYANY